MSERLRKLAELGDEEAQARLDVELRRRDTGERFMREVADAASVANAWAWIYLIAVRNIRSIEDVRVIEGIASTLGTIENLLSIEDTIMDFEFNDDGDVVGWRTRSPRDMLDSMAGWSFVSDAFSRIEFT